MNSNYHSFHQDDLSLETQVLNISVNMARISNWINGLEELRELKGEEIYKSRLELIDRIIKQTESYIEDLNSRVVSDRFLPTLVKLRQDFQSFINQTITLENYLYWAEKTLTWANILQHRAKLA